MMDFTTPEAVKQVADALPLASRAAVTEMARQFEEKLKGSGVQEKRVYAVWTNTDLTEGRGREYIQYHCEKEATANRLAKKNYVMGSDSRVTAEKMFYVNGRWFAPGANIIPPTDADNAEEHRLEAERKAKEEKARVLAKLKDLGITEAELKVLES